MSYEYERVQTPASGLRLHLNENTAGCSPAVIEALRSMSRHDIAAYPDYSAAIAACAARLGVDADSMLLTNGLDEGILAAAMVALKGVSAAAPGDAIVIVPAFDMYAACTDAVGGNVVQVPLREGFAFPIDAVLNAITGRTRLVWLTNPNNPTGQSIPRDFILRITSAARSAMVFVDEAYVDFGGETLIGSGAFDAFPHLVVGRTFAKAYGLAGLRAGAVVGNPRTLSALRRAVPTYSINACAAAVLPAAMADNAYYGWYIDQVKTSRDLLYGALAAHGVEHWKSDANFVLARFPGRGPAVAAQLAARGVHVRDRSHDAGCSDCLRVTAGVTDHTRQFIASLEEIL